MQGSQTDISFVKDLYNNSKNIINSSLKILELTINYKESVSETIPYNFGKELSDFISNIKVSQRQSLALDCVGEIEEEFEILSSSLKKCHKKEYLILELKTLQFELDKTKYHSVLNIYSQETDSLSANISKLNKKFGELFAKCEYDFSELQKTLFYKNEFSYYPVYKDDEFYKILLKILCVIQYLEDILTSLENCWIMPIKQELDNDFNLSNQKVTVEEEDPTNPSTLNSILILLEKIGFFKLPQVENLGENKKGELIAFLTKYKESTCKVTIKEMSESPSAEGRNNPYNTKKAIKDANDFFTKLNS